jgi:putative zinc finger/helix-turn-helix YgiT family protein
MVKMKIECVNCGSSALRTRNEKITFPYRVSAAELVNLETEVPIKSCGNCGFEYSDHEADDARHEAVCRYLGVLCPREIIGVRKGYGMTRAQFAHATKLGEASLARWETGEIIQNAANDNYLRLLMFADNLARIQTKAPSEIPPELVCQDLKERFRSLKFPTEVRDQAMAFAL